MTSIRLPKDLEQRLDNLAKKTERPKNYYLKKALKQFLDEQEEIEWATVAYKEYLESGKATVPFEEIKRKYDLD